MRSSTPATLAVDKFLQADIPSVTTWVDSAARLPSAIRTFTRFAYQSDDPEPSQEFGQIEPMTVKSTC